MSSEGGASVRIQEALRRAARLVLLDRELKSAPAGELARAAVETQRVATDADAKAPSGQSVVIAMREMSWDVGLPGLLLHGRLWERHGATTLLVMMPSAVDRTNPYRHPSFARWQWASSFPDVHFVALADPVMGMHAWLQGAWYMHPEIDVIGAMAKVIGDLAGKLGASNILFYGSSLGGFGALSMAAMLENAKAVAEVPQLDFGRWGPEARADIEDYVIGCDLDDHRERHPEQVSVRSRFEFARRVPPYIIVTNVQEQGFLEQVDFQRWVSTGSDAPRVAGAHELRVTDEFLGHRALGTLPATALIREQLRALESPYS